MEYYLETTGEFSGNGTTDPKSRAFDVRYRLVADARLKPGEAWGISWNQLTLKHPFFRGCKLRSVSVEGSMDAAGRVYEVTASYALEENEDDPMFASLSFSTRGGREKKIHSFETKSYPAFDGGLVPPDFKHGIGFNNGVFEGVDVVVPAFGFSLDADLPASIMTNSMIAFLHTLTGKTNYAPFWIFSQGECLFTGVTGNSYRKPKETPLGKQWEPWFRVSFEFQAQPSFENQNFAPFQNVDKKGMEYLWVFHQDKKDEASGVSVPVPVACYVERVYPYGDFSWFTNLRW